MGAAWWSPWSAERLEDGRTDGQRRPMAPRARACKWGVRGGDVGGGGDGGAGGCLDQRLMGTRRRSGVEEEVRRVTRGGIRWVSSRSRAAVALALVSLRARQEVAAFPNLLTSFSFSARMQISLVCHPCGEVALADDAQTGASPHTHAYTHTHTHSHTPLVVLHTRAMSSA